MTTETDLASAAVISLRLFGWAISGDVAEMSAAVAEGYPWLEASTGWDHGQAWLDRLTVAQYGEPARPARPWAALPWLAEHVQRGHLQWPGLLCLSSASAPATSRSAT